MGKSRRSLVFCSFLMLLVVDKQGQLYTVQPEGRLSSKLYVCCKGG